MRQLLSSLVKHNKITTTETQAKLLKREIERLISRSKKLDLTVRRKALSLFPERPVADKFLDQIVPQFKERVGGYVRVVKLPRRRGDNAPMARIEFVQEIKPAEPIKKEIQKQEPASKPVKKGTKSTVAPKKPAAKRRPAAKKKGTVKK